MPVAAFLLLQQVVTGSIPAPAAEVAQAAGAPVSLRVVSGERAAASPESRSPSADPQEENRACVVVDIAGERAGVLDCANRELGAAARLARTRAQLRQLETPRDVRTDPAALGLSNVAATRNRLGSAFGTGVRPLPLPAPAPQGGLARRH